MHSYNLLWKRVYCWLETLNERFNFPALILQDSARWQTVTNKFHLFFSVKGINLCQILRSQIKTEELCTIRLVFLCYKFCVCVCVCVFILLHCEGFFRLQDVWDIREGYGSTMLWCEYQSRCFCQVPSSPFLNTSYFTSKDGSSSSPKTGEKAIWYMAPRKYIYIYIYISWYRM